MRKNKKRRYRNITFKECTIKYIIHFTIKYFFLSTADQPSVPKSSWKLLSYDFELDTTYSGPNNWVISYTSTTKVIHFQQYQNPKLRAQLTQLEILALGSLSLWTAQPVHHLWFWKHHPGSQKQLTSYSHEVTVVAALLVFTWKLKHLQLQLSFKLLSIHLQEFEAEVTTPICSLVVY